MKKETGDLIVDDQARDYLEETREFISRLRNDLIQKILNSPKKNATIQINPLPYHLNDTSPTVKLNS
jgi:hypothetical protein